MMKTILLAIMFLSQLSLAQVEGHKCGGVGTPLIPDISLLETGNHSHSCRNKNHRKD